MEDYKQFQLVQRSDVIFDHCAGKKVLHLGCTNYPYTEEAIKFDMLLHFQLDKVADELWGLDFDQEGIDILAAHGVDNIFRGDLERLHEVKIDETFDVIVAGEMIEHLNSPGLFLSGIKRFMRPDSRLLITTINAYCAMRFFYYALRGKRGSVELVHPDHVAYYSYFTLKLLLERHGLQVENFLFYDIGREHRPHNRWALNVLNDIFVRVGPQLADGLIAICKLRT